MNEMTTIVILSTILWLLVDWLKPLWEQVKGAKYITMGIALVGAIAITVTFGLDLLLAIGVSNEYTVIGAVFAALSMTAGSGMLNEIIKAISGTKGTQNNG